MNPVNTRIRIENEILSFLGKRLSEEKQASQLMILLMDSYPLLSAAVLAVDDGRSPIVFAHRGLSGNFIKNLYAKGTLPVIDAALSGEIVLSGGDARLSDPAWRFEHEGQSFFAAPCRLQGEALGVLIADSRVPGLFGLPETREAFLAYAQLSAFFLALRSFHHEISRIPDIDTLTGLHNFKFFHEVLHRELARGKKLGNPVSLVFIKVRHLRDMNDVYGHIAADRALVGLSRLVKADLREVDYIARSGSMIYIVMPETSKEEARKVASKILAAMKSPSRERLEVMLKAAIGVATFPDDGETERVLIPHTESMVYESVRKGDNAVTVFGD
jgi:diguanylate cyclase (GGDEF)-like protein